MNVSTAIHNPQNTAHGTTSGGWNNTTGKWEEGKNNSPTNPQSSYYKACAHHDHKPGWEITHTDRASSFIYGDAEKEMDAPPNADAKLIVDVSTGTPFAKTAKFASKLIIPNGRSEFESLQQYMQPPKEVPRLMVPWPDMSAPDIAPQFWQELAVLLPAGRIMFCCLGGHGRTGTALACLRIALWKESAEAAILQVRKDYCERAVETSSQLRYIVQVAKHYGTGTQMDVQPATSIVTKSKKKKGQKPLGAATVDAEKGKWEPSGPLWKDVDGYID